MKNDRKLGQYITSPEFSKRVGDVVEEAVHDLEQRGFAPVYDRRDERDGKEDSTHDR